MDAGIRSPLIDFFRRGEVVRDVRLLAAQGGFAPRAQEQLALLILLSDDGDAEIAATAQATLDKLPEEPLRAFLSQPDVPPQMRTFFASRGIEPSGVAPADPDTPILDEASHAADPDAADEPTPAAPQLLSALPIIDRMKLAMKGTRAQRAQLIRDPNKLVAAAVLSSPKVSDQEVEGFAKIATLPEEIIRAIAANRGWMKNYSVAAALTRNPKTPVTLAMQLLQRLNERDMRVLSMDRNISEAVRIAARRYVVKSAH